MTVEAKIVEAPEEVSDHFNRFMGASNVAFAHQLMSWVGPGLNEDGDLCVAQWLAMRDVNTDTVLYIRLTREQMDVMQAQAAKMLKSLDGKEDN